MFNDFVIDSLLNILHNHSQNSNDSLISFLYVADHGENLYDEFDEVGHDYSSSLPKSNVEVPFMVWLSPAFIDTRSENASFLQKSSTKPFVTDDLFHAAMDLNGIESPYFVKERSIFNEQFDESRKRILEDGNDYDLK